MKIIDLFSGVGGLSSGFEKFGFVNILSIDNWEDAIKTYNHNRKNKNGLSEDIRIFKNQGILSLKKNHKIDGVLGGPPCQGFSSARLSDHKEENRKLNFNRNNLIFDFLDVIKIIKPTFFVIENVRGFLTIDKGSFFQDILRLINEIGYNTNYKLIDTSEYLIPQKRKRVFVVGIKNKKFNFPSKHKKKISAYDAIGDLPSHSSKVYLGNAKTDYQKKSRGDSKILFNHEITKHSDQTIRIISKIPNGGNIKHLHSKFWKIRKFNKAFQRMDKDNPSLTVDTGHRNYFHYQLNRIPTVRENARLQSFPDCFEFLGSKTSQYKQVGNAVPPIFSLELAKEIFNQIK